MNSTEHRKTPICFSGSEKKEKSERVEKLRRKYIREPNTSRAGYQDISPDNAITIRSRGKLQNSIKAVDKFIEQNSSTQSGGQMASTDISSSRFNTESRSRKKSFISESM